MFTIITDHTFVNMESTANEVNTTPNFFIVLNSNDVTHIYKYNTPSVFTCNFSKPWNWNNEDSPNNTIYARIKRLVIDSKVIPHQRGTKLGSIILKECTLNNLSEWGQSAGQFAFPLVDVGSDTGFFAFPSEAPVVKLRSVQLHTLSISIVDLEGRAFKCPESAHPTTIIMEVSNQRFENEDSFTVVLDSKQPSRYPRNTVTDFIIPIPNNIARFGNLSEYEVSLRSITLPKDIREVVSCHLWIQNTKFDYDLDKFWDVSELIDHLSELLKQSEIGRQISVYLEEEKTDDAGFVLNQFEAGRIVFELDFDILNDTRRIEIYMSKSFLLLAGLPIIYEQSFVLSSSNKKVLLKGVEKPNIHRAKPSSILAFHSDIVVPTMNGNNHQQIMDIFPLEYVSGVLYEPKCAAWHTLLPFSNEIAFSIKTIDGRARVFQSENPDDNDLLSTTLTLKFRRRH